MSNKKNILLFGSSYMADEYLKVLKALGCNVIVTGRDQLKAETLAQKYGFNGLGGGAEALAKAKGSVDSAIIASSIESLYELTIACLKQGIKNILVEKPGALDLSQLYNIKRTMDKDTKYSVAYNRRYYNSVMSLKTRILNDGGPIGCFFDFTDREKDVLTNTKASEVKQKWGLANSSHVIDIAFYLAGMPKEISAVRSGGYDVHPSGNIFTGSGKTSRCPFSYFSTWAGGGRWNIEISTSQGRYRLQPLEELYFCKKNQFSWEEIENKDQDDIKYKPGLFKMTKDFLDGKSKGILPDIDAQIEFVKVINRIFGYEE